MPFERDDSENWSQATVPVAVADKFAGVLSAALMPTPSPTNITPTKSAASGTELLLQESPDALTDHPDALCHRRDVLTDQPGAVASGKEGGGS